jgi:hypothetical protein
MRMPKLACTEAEGQREQIGDVGSELSDMPKSSYHFYIGTKDRKFRTAVFHRSVLVWSYYYRRSLFKRTHQIFNSYSTAYNAARAVLDGLLLRRVVGMSRKRKRRERALCSFDQAMKLEGGTRRTLEERSFRNEPIEGCIISKQI